MECRASSLEAGEQLIGTAPHAEHWLLLQYASAWGAKALEESELAPEQKRAVERLVADVPHGRLGLIKQGAWPGGLTLFAVSAQAHNPTMFRYEFDSYDDLVSLSAADLFAGRVAGATPHLTPVYAVCTNGKRDRCCAELGVPLYQRLAGPSVWQITHVGGHRFAGNLVCFPHGLVYGRVDAESGPKVVEAYQDGRMELAWCRGRSTWPEAVQAAELLLRQAWGESRIDFIRGAHWDGALVTFQVAEGGPVTVAVDSQAGSAQVQASCGKSTLEPVMTYRLAQPVESR